MSGDPATDWERWECARGEAGALAVLFFALALASGVVSFFTTTNIRVIPVICTLLGSHAMTAWLLCGHVVRLSSALFMKQQALQADLSSTGVKHVSPGDTLVVSPGSGVILEFHTSSKFRVIR